MSDIVNYLSNNLLFTISIVILILAVLFFVIKIKKYYVGKKFYNSAQDAYIKGKCFSIMTKEQRYAYITLIEAFYTFGNNVKVESNSKWYKDVYEMTKMESMIQYNYKLLGTDKNEVKEAVAYFEDRIWINIRDVLKEIKEPSTLDLLLVTCYTIAKTKRGIYDGKDLNKLANDMLYDIFNDIGLSREYINNRIEKIK